MRYVLHEELLHRVGIPGLVHAAGPRILAFPYLAHLSIVHDALRLHLGSVLERVESLTARAAGVHLDVAIALLAVAANTSWV